MHIGPQHGMTRRGLLEGVLAGAWVASAAPEKSKVVVARDPALRAAGGSPDSGRVLKMLDRAMQSFYGGDSPIDAWKKVARPGEVIGLKVNCLSGRGAATNPVLVEAICERLQQAGIPRTNIVIWDRLNSDLESAGYRRSLPQRSNPLHRQRYRRLRHRAGGLWKRGQPAREYADTHLRCRDQLARAQGPRHRRRDARAQKPVRRDSQSEQVPHERRRPLRCGRQYVSGRSGKRCG